MAELPNFSSPRAKAGLSPSGRGSAAAVMEGNAWNSAFKSLGRNAQDIGNTAEKFFAQRDASKLGKDTTEAFSSLTQSWNDYAKNADPNDNDVSERWRNEVLEPALVKLGADMASKTGDDLAEKAKQSLRQHFTQKADADEMVRSGVAVESNLNAAANAVTNAAYADPTSFKTGMDLFHGFMREQVATHNVDAVTAARIAGEFTVKVGKTAAESAITGMAETNPAAALKALESGEFNQYFSGEEAAKLKTYAISQGKLDATLREKANRDSASADMAKLQASVVQPDGTLTLPMNYYSNVLAWNRKYGSLPGVAAGADEATRAAINFGRSLQADLEKGVSPVTDPHTYSDFEARAFLPPGDPRKLTSTEVLQARASHLLSDKDFTFWNGAVNELSRDDAQSFEQKDFIKFLDGYKGYITKSSFLNVDAQGDQKNYEFRSWAQTTRNQMRAAKVPEKEIRAAIVNAIPQFQVSQAEAIKGMGVKASGNLQPLPVTAPKTGFRKINPGESWEAYKKARGY